MSFEMTSAQKQAFTDASSGLVSTTDATNMVALVVSAIAITWLLIIFMGYSKKAANKEIGVLDYLFPVSIAIFVIILVASIMFS